MKVTISATIILFLICCQRAKITPDIPKVEEDRVLTLSFGSCNNQDRTQILWDDILQTSPDVWIWLGDNVYGDTSDSIAMRQKYDKQKANLVYQALAEKAKIYGIWDDHDYGLNDGGKEFEAKSEMRDEMLMFLDVPKENEVWNREGGYQSYVVTKNDFSVKLILLDSRYFRDPTIKQGNAYEPNLTGTVLGSEQWNWLEKELEDTDHDLLIIGNGIQVISEEHRFEKWANFPNEREKLLKLLENQDLPPTILLSGDRHLTEVSKIDNGKTIYDITCSGMTHSYTSYSGEPNKHRIGEVVTEKNFGLLKVVNVSGQKKFIFEARGDDEKLIQSLELVY